MSQNFHSASFPSIGSLMNQPLNQSNNQSQSIRSPSPHAPSVNSDVTSQTMSSLNLSKYEFSPSSNQSSDRTDNPDNQSNLQSRRRGTGPLDTSVARELIPKQHANPSAIPPLHSSSNQTNNRRFSVQSDPLTDSEPITSIDQLISQPTSQSSTPRNSQLQSANQSKSSSSNQTTKSTVNQSSSQSSQPIDEFDSDFVHVASDGPSAVISQPSINRSIKQLFPRSSSLSNKHVNSQSPRNQSTSQSSSQSKWSFGSLIDSISTASVKNSAIGNWVNRATDSINQAITQSFNQSNNHSDSESDEEDYMSTINDHQSINQASLIDDVILMTEGQYDVSKADFSIEQKKNYRFLDLNPRSQKARENWFLFYESTIERQFFAWHNQSIDQSGTPSPSCSGVDFRDFSRRQLVNLCRMGVPAMMRPMVWAHNRRLHEILAANEGKYKQLWRRGLTINQSTQPRNEEDQTINQSIKMIDKDLDRTFINHPAFHFSPMLERLRRVLISFSCLHPEIGYCQSMNFLCGFLLLLFDEESAFWLLNATIMEMLPNDYFTDSMVGLHADLDVFDRLVAERMPELHSHLSDLRVDMRPIAFPWFLSLFIKTLPMESALRFWDCFFIEGDKMLFRVALSLLSINQTKILKITNFGRLYHYLSTMGSMMFDCDQLMTIAFEQRNLSNKRLAAMRNEHRTKLCVEMEQLALKRVSSTASSTNASRKQSNTDQSINQSINQSNNQSVNQSITPSSNSLDTPTTAFSFPTLPIEQSNNQTISPSNSQISLGTPRQAIERTYSEPDTPMATLTLPSNNQSNNQTIKQTINRSTDAEWSEDDDDCLPHASLSTPNKRTANRSSRRSSNPIASSLAQNYDETYIT